MQSTLKTKVTVATIYVVFTDKTKASETRRVLFFGSPTKAEVKKAFDKTINMEEVKKSTICELEKTNLDLNFTSAFLTKTLEDFIIESAKEFIDFDSTVVD